MKQTEKIIQIVTVGKDTLIALTSKGNLYGTKPGTEKWIEVQKPKELSQ